MRKFGFAVRYLPPDATDQGGWKVTLPEQHDEWAITGADYYAPPVPHDEAVAALEQFITEANQALAALRAKKEFPND